MNVDINNTKIQWKDKDDKIKDVADSDVTFDETNLLTTLTITPAPTVTSTYSCIYDDSDAINSEATAYIIGQYYNPCTYHSIFYNL